MQTVPQKVKHILLVGNPNVGKSTVFNLLCNKNQKTGNYAGVTVASHQGTYNFEDEEVEIVDLPGSYSIYPTSEDEAIFTKYLIEEQEKYSGVIYVADALNLKRSLLLFQQIRDLGIPVLMVVNQIDLARKRGLNIDNNRVGIAILNRTNYEMVDGKRNYLKLNYSKVSDVDKMNQLQAKVWGTFIKKSMASGAVNQKSWSTSAVVSPVGLGYDWNYVSADGYTNYEDVLDGGWASTPTIPDLSEIGKLIGGAFYKSVVWKIVMSVNNKGEFSKN